MIQSNETVIRKVRLLPIHPGLLKMNDLIFLDKLTNNFIKAGINLFFTIEE